MIGKGKSISYTRASMSYGWNQEKNTDVVLKRYLYGENPAEVTKEFKLIQQQNCNCTNNTLSFVLSPTIEDGKNLQAKDFQQIVTEFIKQMKLEERQAIAFVHQDKEHKHIHLYVNRIDFKGVAYNDSYIGKRSQKAAERVAERLQLTTVKQIQFEKEFHLRELRTEIKRRHDLSMQQFKPISFDAYIKAMETNGVLVIPTINNQQKLQGFRFEFQGTNLKGSEVHRAMSMGNIGKAIAMHPSAAIFKDKSSSVVLLGKTVELSANMALKITKFILNKSIQYGIGY